MTDEPGNPITSDPTAAHPAVRPSRVSTLANDGSLGIESGRNSPARWLLVIVPAVILLAAVTNLLGVWSTSFQQADREARLRELERTASAPPDALVPAPIERVPAPHSPHADPTLPNPAFPAPPIPAPKAETPPPFDAAEIVAMLPTADVERGAQSFKICSVCHSAEKAAGHKIGPNLWNVVGNRKAAAPDFAHSVALRNIGGTWTFEDLAEFLHDPRAYAPGTKMALAGITNPTRLANIIAYLRTLSDDPVPLPE